MQERRRRVAIAFPHRYAYVHPTDKLYGLRNEAIYYFM